MLKQDAQIKLMRDIVKQLDRLNDNMEKMLKIITTMKDEFYGK
jgi:hypothetical protein